jgi:D-alanyl-D-alanine dipeptidase
MAAAGFAKYEREWWHFTFGVAGAPPFDRVIRARGSPPS